MTDHLKALRALVEAAHPLPEADWQALQTTKDPESGRRLFQQFTRTSLQQPKPPTWSYLYFDTHPTAIQRIAMMQAWRERQNR